MNDEEHKKLSILADKITSMTFVLKAYCENFEQNISELSKLYEFAEILNNTSNEIYDLL